MKLAFQPGTFQIKFGVETYEKYLQPDRYFFCNVEEAKKILKWGEQPAAGGQSPADTTTNARADEVKKLMKAMSALGPKMVFITDGIDGAYAFDGTDNWFMPVYPHKPYERTGAGDAFSSTVTVALALGKSVPEALSWGPINSMSVVQYVGAQEGLLTREKLLDYLAKAPADYKPRKI